ncbi:hypothetical protein AB0D00_26580 [Streptomyces sp. NPDC048213]|uniref:hypothetical protein n=1 Tax=Streptomyces sp. NPDC048213 TaxID=3160984 RepID=UPI0033D8BEA6
MTGTDRTRASRNPRDSATSTTHTTDQESPGEDPGGQGAAPQMPEEAGAATDAAEHQRRDVRRSRFIGRDDVRTIIVNVTPGIILLILSQLMRIRF